MVKCITHNVHNLFLYGDLWDNPLWYVAHKSVEFLSRFVEEWDLMNSFYSQPITHLDYLKANIKPSPDHNLQMLHTFISHQDFSFQPGQHTYHISSGIPAGYIPPSPPSPLLLFSSGSYTQALTDASIHSQSVGVLTGLS